VTRPLLSLQMNFIFKWISFSFPKELGPHSGTFSYTKWKLSFKTTMSIGFWIHVKTNCFQSPYTMKLTYWLREVENLEGSHSETFPYTKWKFKFKNYNVNWLLDTCQNQLFPKSLHNETYICHKRLHHISSTQMQSWEKLWSNFSLETQVLSHM
jgi:hypothetical protein